MSDPIMQFLPLEEEPTEVCSFCEAHGCLADFRRVLLMSFNHDDFLLP